MTSYQQVYTSEMVILNNVQRSIGVGTRANTANYSMDTTTRSYCQGVEGSKWPNSVYPPMSASKHHQGAHMTRKKNVLKITDKNGNVIDLSRKDDTNVNQIRTQRKDDVVVSNRKKHMLKITDKDGNEIDLSMYRAKSSKKKEEGVHQVIDRKKNVLKITDKNGNDIALPRMHHDVSIN